MRCRHPIPTLSALAAALALGAGSGCAGSSARSEAGSGALYGSIGGAVAGGLSSALWGGGAGIGETMVKSAVIGAGSGAAVGAVHGAVKDASRPATKSPAAPQSKAAVPASIQPPAPQAPADTCASRLQQTYWLLARRQNREAIVQARNAYAIAATPAQQTDALFIQAVAALETGDKNQAASLYPRIQAVDPSGRSAARVQADVKSVVAQLPAWRAKTLAAKR